MGEVGGHASTSLLATCDQSCFQGLHNILFKLAWLGLLGVLDNKQRIHCKISEPIALEVRNVSAMVEHLALEATLLFYVKLSVILFVSVAQAVCSSQLSTAETASKSNVFAEQHWQTNDTQLHSQDIFRMNP